MLRDHDELGLQVRVGCHGGRSGRLRWFAEAFGEGDTAPVKAVVQKVMTESSQANAWAPAVIDCINAATADGMQACSAQLTPAQQEALTKAMADEMGARQKQDEAVEPTDGAKSMDPCAGGE